MAKHLRGLGFTVFAGCLLADKKGEGAEELRHLASPKLHVVQLDVTKQDQWDTIKDYIKKNSRFHVICNVIIYSSLIELIIPMNDPD